MPAHGKVLATKAVLRHTFLMPSHVSLTINQISAAQTLALRQAVLWPEHPIEASKVEGDETALHFGGFLGGDLICVASLFQDGGQDGGGVRLRKFATDPAHQGKGFGSDMLVYLVAQAREAGASDFWFDARETALGFYERHGFTTKGERFFKKGLPYWRMSLALG
ncbi:GNAT family N-acetyltransferase [Cognatishimia sp.]|uniref:GNAT family N-acetyltransferase n=1 Tax=Cognatishimia sp. TaxID=2211648 RepID=UPI003516E38C